MSETMVAVWRRAPKGSTHTPLVVVLHGRGADEHDLLPVVERLPRTMSYASLRAFVDVEGGGYTWFENRGVARPIAKSVRASAATIRRWLDDVAPTPTPVYLLGFSAGMMMAGALLFDDPQRYAGAVLLSGALPFESGLDCGPGRLAGIPVLYARGTLDDVIPFDLVDRSVSYLRDVSRAELTEQAYDHGHSISLREVQDIAAWLSAR